MYSVPPLSKMVSLLLSRVFDWSMVQTSKLDGTLRSSRSSTPSRTPAGRRFSGGVWLAEANRDRTTVNQVMTHPPEVMDGNTRPSRSMAVGTVLGFQNEMRDPKPDEAGGFGVYAFCRLSMWYG